MRTELHFVLRFVWEVVTNWLVLVSGGIAALIGVAEKYMGRQVHLSFYTKVLVAFVFISVYLSWRNKAAALVELRDKADNSPALEIARLRAEVEKLHHEKNQELEGEWPPLSDDQIREWSTALLNQDIKIISIAWNQNVGGKSLYKSIQAISKNIGAELQYVSGGSDFPGISLHCYRPFTSADEFKSLFEKAGYPVKMEIGAEEDTNKRINVVTIVFGEKRF